MKKSKKSILFLCLLTAISSTLVQAEEYQLTPMKQSTSGVELRLNGLYSSGRFVQNITKDDSSTIEKTSDLTTKGFSVLVGYAREYRKRDQSSFFYVGYESQKWNDAYDSRYHAFIAGVEGGVGNAMVKFIYGGEFAFGALDTGKDGLGYLSTFTAEPYIGLRLLSSSGFSLNFRGGVRAYAIEGAKWEITGGSVSSSNSAYSGNIQVGLGYQFH